MISITWFENVAALSLGPWHVSLSLLQSQATLVSMIV